MTEFVILRARLWGATDGRNSPPAHIAEIERETPQFLVGYLVNEEGKRDVVRVSLYDMRPGFKPSVEGRSQFGTGKFAKPREVARFPTFEQAAQALAVARQAWASVPEFDVLNLQSAVASRKEALTAERKRITAEMAVQLEPLTLGLNTALGNLKAATEALTERRNADMLAAIQPAREVA
ncbi:hypothetical protein [Methylobacterium sp. WCS2018Hpa-22]|uniref:hypothetical protein n=1 Tax=Methylobacterium sp. WCS2018Hpa-22 TaxID=3073633 RepID=UPI00288C38F0|nr:hypothetical protein [Methylobacterium sp. WCS2018Hpa-22]